MHSYECEIFAQTYRGSLVYNSNGTFLNEETHMSRFFARMGGLGNGLRRWGRWLPIVAAVALFGFGDAEPAADGPLTSQASAAQFQRPIAPDFDTGLDWLNTEKPLSLADLRGRVVLLDFWTLC